MDLENDSFVEEDYLRCEIRIRRGNHKYMWELSMVSSWTLFLVISGLYLSIHPMPQMILHTLISVVHWQLHVHNIYFHSTTL